MTPPRDPDEVEQTLLPDAPAVPRTPVRPVKPATETPGPFDATVDTPVAPTNGPTDPHATLPLVRPAPAPVPAVRGTEARSEATADGIEPTLLPSSAPTGGTPGTVVGAADATGADPADPGATLPTPVGRTMGAGGGLGSDTAPVSVSAGPGPRPGASPSATGTMVGRFALKGLHASGGLGEVFTARDTELNREVAVKRIKSHYADDPGSRSRFLSEATLTARLDHPGVVPVFGLVNDVRGRPCYAMRFIRGETLKDEIDRYHGQKAEDRGQKTDTSDKTGGAESAAGVAAAPEGAAAEVPRSVAFRHLLARFIATCQAIAYAHKKNIIHRDIKPANIMVGSFGETLVVDWGLAKSLDDGPDFDRMMKAAAATGFRHDPEATDLPSHMTHAGTAVGTPAYMAPEQAAGDIEKVGTRADVYALGATLFVIITGKAPVAGKNTVEVLDHVRRGAYEPAAVVNPKCPKPLDAIARKAMALRQEDRYATALELADDVERWLSDEPVSCYHDPAPARLARWARHHPTRVASGASILLASMVAAISIAVVYQQGEQARRGERDRAIAAEKDTADERDKVKLAQAATVAANRELENKNAELKTEQGKVEVARNAAIKRYDKAVAAYGVLIHDVDKRLADRVGMEDLRNRLLLSATDGLNQLIAEEARFGADRTLVAAYRQMGEVYQLLGDTPQAVANFKRAVEGARAVKADPALADKKAANRDLARSLDKFAGILVQAGKSGAALTEIGEAIELFAALAADPKDAQAQADLAGARARRSTIRLELGDTRGALKDCVAALAARKALAPDKLPANAKPADAERLRDYAASLDAMAGLQLRTGPDELRASGDPEVMNLPVGTGAALASATAARDLRVALVGRFADHPDVPREAADAHARLGEIHFERGHMTAAAAEYGTGLEVLEALRIKNPQSAGARADLALMHGRLGHAQVRLGEIERAIKNTEIGRELAVQLQRADPTSSRARRDLALAHERYGDALAAAWRLPAALDEYRASEKLLRLLWTADEAGARGQIELARGLERLGDGYLAKGDMTGAVREFESCVKLRRAVFDGDTHSARAKRDLAVGLYKLAEAHCGSGRPGRAEKSATEATEYFVELAQGDPTSAQAQRDLALAYGKWGQVLFAGGHSTGAMIMWLNALERCEKLMKVDEKNTQALEDEATAWERLAGLYAAVRNTGRALIAARTAINKWEAIGKGVDSKTKAGRRRLALAMLRFGDANTDAGQTLTAGDWYKKAADEARAEPGDPLLAPIAEQAKSKLVYLKAVEEGLVRPTAVLGYDLSVQLAALPTVSRLALRSDNVPTAHAAAALLVTIAKEAPDRFAAARALAECAANASVNEKLRADYAKEALAQLKSAIAAGFLGADALSEPEWEAVAERVKEFAQVQKQLEELRNTGK